MSFKTLSDTKTPSIFLTGATGYIGGEVLYTLVQAHPDWPITAIVRNSDKGAKVAAAYPSVKLVYGDLEAADEIKKAATTADIVLNVANSDNVPALDAIIASLSSKESTSYLIHTSGAMNIANADRKDPSHLGLLNPQAKSYNDTDGVADLWDLPSYAAHNITDKLIFNTHSEHANINTALVCPPCIYGNGRGPDNTRSMQIPNAAKGILQRKKGFLPGKGENTWNEVHVQDLGQVYLLLVEAAAAELAGQKSDKSEKLWNAEGFYLAESGTFSFGTAFKRITKIVKANGWCETEESDELGVEELDALSHYGRWLWGTTSKGEGRRAREWLGWKPVQPSLLDDRILGRVVEREARALGILGGHAAQVEKD